MILKEGVRIIGIRPEVLFALNVCDAIYSKYGEELVITSVNDGRHSKSSLHYAGLAVDLRTRYFDAEEVPTIAEDIRSRLGIDYDVVVEKDHIHLEFNPKYRG